MTGSHLCYPINDHRYFELRPLYDQSQERGRELDREVMRLKEELAEAELRHQKMYLQMFLKGQQAARIQAEDDLVSLGGELCLKMGVGERHCKGYKRTAMCKGVGESRGSRE